VYGISGILHGCENDAKKLRTISEKNGYKISALLTEQATRKNFISKMEDLATELQAGDKLLITYSGHGSQIESEIGDPNPEPDGYDETWCMFDGQLVDDELNALYGKFRKGVRIIVVSDSCHSGTISRELSVIPRARYLPANLLKRTSCSKSKALIKENREIVASVKTLAACQDNQLSFEENGEGIFTRTLFKTWLDMVSSWKKATTNDEYFNLHKKVVKLMPENQTPNYTQVGITDDHFNHEKPFII
jgi:hypothetical protein